MSDMQKFDDNIIKNLHMFSLKDDEQVYTNGVELVPLYRVVQILEHFKVQELVDKVPYYEELEAKATPKKPIKDKFGNDCCPNCKSEEIKFLEFDRDYGQVMTLNFCQDCGQALDWSNDEPK